MIDDLDAMQSEDDWQNREGIEDELSWLYNGISLYRKLFDQYPSERKYQYILAKLLLRAGRSEKESSINRRKAKILFYELLKVDPNHVYAYYHLGFLELFSRKWQSAITLLAKCIESDRLEESHKIKALCNLAICYDNLGNHQQAQQCIIKAQELDKKDKRYSTEIEFVKLQLSDIEGQNKSGSFIIISDNGSSEWITYEHADELVAIDQFVILDCRQAPVFLRTPLDTVSLQPKVAMLIHLLMSTKCPLTQIAIKQQLWPETSNSDIVRIYIDKLRRAIARCFNEPVDTVIKNIPYKGYRWQCSTPYRIIQSTSYACGISCEEGYYESSNSRSRRQLGNRRVFPDEIKNNDGLERGE